MLTVPKIRDLINKPKEQYNELLKNKPIITNQTLIDIDNDNDNEEMCSELKKYVEELIIKT
jgi:hypothetical protein